MKKITYLFMLIPLITLASCDNLSVFNESDSQENSDTLSSDKQENSDTTSSSVNSNVPDDITLDVRNEELFRLSSIDDSFTANGDAIYGMLVPYTDSYNFTGSNLTNIKLYDKDENLLKEGSSFDYNLNANDTVYVEITGEANKAFKFRIKAKDHFVVLPYEVNSNVSLNDFKTSGNNNVNPTKAAEIEYVKRHDSRGLYVNCNNPELLSSNELNKALTRQYVTGKDVFFTFEHNNGIKNFYYGYRVTNKGNKDLYITINNLGYQMDGAGTWLGEKEWVDFYNLSFRYDPSNWTESQKANFKAWYGFCNEYNSKNRQPITYRIPAGKYIYAIGGTTQDAYNNINVFESANQRVTGAVGNGAVLFSCRNSTAEGSFLIYNDYNASTINNSKYVTGSEQNGYVYNRDGVDVGSQYVGYDTCHGVVDADFAWTINDKTENGVLKVSYTNPYNTSQRSGKQYSIISNLIEQPLTNVGSWVTHINPNSTYNAVGTDMTKYITIDNVTKQEVIIDPEHFDGKGELANIGNWMVDYIDTFTLVNQGDKKRNFTYFMRHNGAILAFIRNKDGLLVDSYKPKYCIYKSASEHGDAIYDGFTYTVEIPAHSIVRFSVDYNLLANSNGYIFHQASLSD